MYHFQRILQNAYSFSLVLENQAQTLTDSEIDAIVSTFPKRL